MLDGESVPRQAYERLLSEYRALVEHVQLPRLSADRFRRAQQVLAMGQREIEDAEARATRPSASLRR